MPGPAVHRRRREEDRLEAELLDAAARLVDRAGRRRAARPCPRRTCGRARRRRSPSSSRCTRGRSRWRTRARGRRCRPARRSRGPSTNSPRDGNSTARSRPSASIAVDLRLRRPSPRASDVGVDVVVLLAPARSCGRRRASGCTRAQAQHHVVLHLHPHVARDLGQAARRGVRVRRVDVALPEVGRLHHVQVAVADHVVAKAHRGNLTLVAPWRCHGVRCAPPGSAAEPHVQGEGRCRSASSGSATSAATSPPTSSPTVTRSSVFDVDARACRGDRGRRARRRRSPTVGAASEITVLSLPTPAVVRQVADEWATTAAPGAVLVDLSTNSPEVVRELGARLAATGSPPRRGAAHRRRASAPRTACCRSWSAATTTPSHGCSRSSNRSGAPSCHLGPLGLGNTMKLVNSLHRVHHDVGEPRRALAGGEVGHPGAAGRRGAAHQRRRQLLPRPHGREHRHPQRGPRSSRSSWRPRTPASSSRPGARSACRRPPGAAVLQVLVGAIAAGLGDHDWGDLVAAAERQGDVELHWNTDPDRPVRHQAAS